jgi:predicted N-acyltransferase
MVIQVYLNGREWRARSGAQGQHKISRAYLPTTTYSAHYIVDP